MFALNLNAQKKIYFEDAMKLRETTGLKLNSKAEPFLNEAKILKTEYTCSEQNISNFHSTANKSISPSATIVTKTWGQIKNIDNNELQMFQMDYQYGTGANVSIKLMDDNMATVRQINFNIPETTNSIRMIAQASSAVGSSTSELKLMIFLHYFEGGIGPNFQKSKIWVVDGNGEKIGEFDATGAYLLKKPSGNPDILTYFDDNTNVRMKIYDSELNPKNSLTVPTELIMNYSGSPLNFLNVKGEDKIVVVHYEKKYMDNSTLEVTPDNHLLVKIYDTGLSNLEKIIPLDISTIYPEQPYTFALGKFGTYFLKSRYDITDNVFNSDDSLEIMYGIDYEDLLHDKSWTNYYVANEQGNRIKSLEKDIIDIYEMDAVEGQDNQIGLIIGSGNMGTGIEMFSIESWNTDISFPAVYNGDQLSIYFNRIKDNGGYSYLMGLGQAVNENGTYYGVINNYSKTGEFIKNIKLNIGETPMSFIPILWTGALTPNVYNTDNAMEYTYVYKMKNMSTNKIFNVFNVAKENSDIIFSVNGETEKGDVQSSGFVLDKTGGKFNKLAVTYRTSSTYYTTEFYDLPFSILATQENSAGSVKVYTDKVNNIVGWTEKADAYEIYDIAGRTVRKGSNAFQASTQSLSKGVYIIRLATKHGLISKKFMIQ